jgi:hypothetical protein
MREKEEGGFLRQLLLWGRQQVSSSSRPHHVVSSVVPVYSGDACNDSGWGTPSVQGHIAQKSCQGLHLKPFKPLGSGGEQWAAVLGTEFRLEWTLSMWKSGNAWFWICPPHVLSSSLSSETPQTPEPQQKPRGCSPASPSSLTWGRGSAAAEGHCEGALTHTVFSSALALPQPLRTMKSACSGSACGRESGKGLSGAGSTRSMATSSWPPTFGSPPTAPTAEISSGKPPLSGNL